MTPVYSPHGIRFPDDYPDLDTARQMMEFYQERDSKPTRQPWIAMLASQSWKDEDWLEEFVTKTANKYPKTTFIHTGKRAAQGTLVTQAEFLGLRIIQCKPLYLAWLADIIMAFSGGTKDTVDDTIRRALLTHRPTGRFYPGLHVYKMTRSKKTRSGRGGEQTGKIEYLTRHSFDLVKPDVAKKRIKTKGEL
jgi:hypothetical protein